MSARRPVSAKVVSWSLVVVLVAGIGWLGLVRGADTETPPETPIQTATSTSTSAETGVDVPTDAPVPSPTADPGSTAALLASLEVRSADPAAPYVRDLFDGGDWDYDPATGCNTRELVLIEESTIEPQVDDRCRTTLGRWWSLYDATITDDPADLQIDHFVPLADAWRSGAHGWTPERRKAFANDRTSPDTLIAVSGSLNQSKGDRTPDEWLPPDRSSWCTYAEMWVDVKAAWRLSVTAPERTRLGELLIGC